MKPSTFSTALVIGAVAAWFACSGKPANIDEQVVQPTPAPLAPPPITRAHPTKVIVNLDVVEKVVRVADGDDYTFWTFDGIPRGSAIRVRAGDEIELNLRNHPDNRMAHSIDLRAVTGPRVGASCAFTAPGHQSRLAFKATNPGVLVYHCATAPVGVHIVNEMYGQIVVEPEEGLPDVDRDSDQPELIGDLLQRMLRVEWFENPTIRATGTDDPTYVIKGGADPRVAAASRTAIPATRTQRDRIDLGEQVYYRACVDCHKTNGLGTPAENPPLAGSDYLMADLRRSIEIVVRGMHGEIEVNGQSYDGVMPATALTDDEVANVLTFVRNSWGNDGDMVILEDVEAVRNAALNR